MSLLITMLQFASNYVNITVEERYIVLHAKKSLLYNTGEPWGKKSSSGLFDVTMGSIDGAETRELVGVYLLHNIRDTHDCNFGLHREDGLGITNASRRQTRKVKKNLCDIFDKYGLKITIKANKKIINFLDVSLNLSTGTYTPFNKSNKIPLNINKKSNHPPPIISNIPQSTNRRLSEIVSTKQHHSIWKPSTTAVTCTSSHFLQTSQPKLQTLRAKIGRETSFGTTPHLASTFLLTSGVLSLDYLTRNPPRSMCYVRSLTETPLRSAIVACQTSNKTSTATTNPSYTRRSCRQHLAIIEWKQNALWVETASKNPLFTKRPSRQKIITLPRPTCD